MSEIVAQPDIRIVALTLAVVMFAAWGIGKRLGSRLRNKGLTRSSKFADASVALLGLLIAFTFGMSIERHDRRRLAAVADSNAIGDFYTCVSLLSDPTRTKLQSVVRQYAQLRLETARGARGEGNIESALARFDQMHSEMTQLVAQALSHGTPIAVSLTNTLNAVTSNQASRLAAFKDRLPASILALLFAATIASVMLIGREQGVDGTNDVAGTILFIVLVSLAIYVTLDLNQPERGLIRVSQEPIERLLNSMSK